MFKKVLSSTVLGVSALGMMAANAATCANANNLTPSSSSAVMASSNAVTSGVYVTGQIGYADTGMGSKTNLSPYTDYFTANNPHDKNLSNNGLAGRLALGYQFNQNFAVEAGYLQLGQRKVNVTQHMAPLHSNGSLNLQQNAIDLVGKAMLPVASKLNVYGKLGVAYLTTAIKGELSSDEISHVSLDFNNNVGVNKHIWAPEAAVGVSYDISPNVSVDTSWTHIQPLGHNNPGNIDFVAVGLGYNFG